MIECCVGPGGPVPLSEIAAGTGLPKATAWRIAEGLVRSGLLGRTNHGYIGGVRLVEKGNWAARQLAFRPAVLPEIVELHRVTGAPVWAVDIRDDEQWVIVASVYGSAAARNNYSDDWCHDPQAPAVLASALGRMALARRPEHVDGLLRVGIPRLTSNTETNPKRLDLLLRRATDEQVIVEHGGVWLGWSCMALPVVEPLSRRTIGVVGVVERTPRFIETRFLVSARRVVNRVQSAWAESSAS